MSPSLLDHANPSKHIARAECPQKPTTVGRGTHPLARDHKHEAPDSQGLSDSSGGRTRTDDPRIMMPSRARPGSVPLTPTRVRLARAEHDRARVAQATP